jgi:hypothetical protein
METVVWLGVYSVAFVCWIFVEDRFSRPRR